jgi:hypothetical protein
MGKFTYEDVVDASRDLWDAVFELNESFKLDPVDLETPYRMVPDYVWRCAEWMKMDTSVVGDKMETVSTEPVELIIRAAKVARKATLGDKQSVVIAFVDAAQACYTFCKAVYPFLPADKQEGIPSPPDFLGATIKTEWKLLTGRDWPDKERVLERPPGDKGKKPPPPQNENV